MFNETLKRGNNTVTVEGVAPNKFVITVYNEDNSIRYVGTTEKYDASVIDNIFKEINL